MAKSLRSKTKRSYRAHKREDSVYAATAAARLDRLHAKLSAVARADIPREEDEMEQDEDAVPGWSWFSTLGLLDLHDITPATLAATTRRAPLLVDDSFLAAAADADADPSMTDSMQVEGKKISTHGPRGSRREEWRLSKGMSARPTAKGMNRQGQVAARRKAGRSKRRR
ncbi:hypothetical protein MKEN_00073000 [Mycena kentingensis (nom. inval.)]|nr:hypothetical protein MKEN_00073000 [Mycena kentingensis (nom. inval.)]